MLQTAAEQRRHLHLTCPLARFCLWATKKRDKEWLHDHRAGLCRDCWRLLAMLATLAMLAMLGRLQVLNLAVPMNPRAWLESRGGVGGACSSGHILSQRHVQARQRIRCIVHRRTSESQQRPRNVLPAPVVLAE